MLSEFGQLHGRLLPAGLHPAQGSQDEAVVVLGCDRCYFCLLLPIEIIQGLQVGSNFFDNVKCQCDHIKLQHPDPQVPPQFRARQEGGPPGEKASFQDRADLISADQRPLLALDTRVLPEDHCSRVLCSLLCPHLCDLHFCLHGRFCATSMLPRPDQAAALSSMSEQLRGQNQTCGYGLEQHTRQHM